MNYNIIFKWILICNILLLCILYLLLKKWSFKIIENLKIYYYNIVNICKLII